MGELLDRESATLWGSDTMACIAGVISEAFYGEVPDSIARQTLDRLDARLRSIVMDFTGKYGNSRIQR